MNNGQWTIREEDAGTTLAYWLGSLRRLGSRLRAEYAIGAGMVFVNGVVQTSEDADKPLQAGDVVRAWADRQDVHEAPFIELPFDYLDIVYEDRYLLVLNKPAGLLSTPHPFILEEQSLFDLAEEYLNAKKRQPFIVHRIDRDTTGLVLFAKTLETQEKLREQFERREPERIYLAVTRGIPQPEVGSWQDRFAWSRKLRRFAAAKPDDEHIRDALCHYRVLERFGNAALIEVRLFTGRRNQIRLQAQLHGHPLVGEKIFTDDASPGETFHRQALHAYQLNFRHPINQRAIKLEAPVPDDFNELLARLRDQSQRRGVGVGTEPFAVV